MIEDGGEAGAVGAKTGGIHCQDVEHAILQDKNHNNKIRGWSMKTND